MISENTQARSPLIEKGRVVGLFIAGRDQEHAQRGKVLVDATGRINSLVSKLQKTEPKRAAYVAFKSHLTDTGCEKEACEIYFFRGGYGGVNFVENSLTNLCFMVESSKARSLGNDPERILQELVLTNPRARETLSHYRLKSDWISTAFNLDISRKPDVQGLINVGDALAFNDPFTGTGILMALESGELAASQILHHLRTNSELEPDYYEFHQKTFRARLRLSSLLRSIAFGPVFLSEGLVFLLNSSTVLREFLFRSTRQG
jgi:menaquinone-9 beta-reductase